MEKNVYDVFLCHTGVDKEWVKNLGGNVESEQHNGKNLTVFLDEWDISPSESIPAKINYALDHCRHMVIVLSPEMVASPWPNAEWESMYMSDPGGRKGTMIPVLLRNCQIPPLLRPITRLDFRDNKDFKNEYSKLLRVLKGQRMQRGSSTRQLVERVHELDTREPDSVPEKISSNIYPVTSFPKFIWGADTSHYAYQSVYDDLSSYNGFIPPFILKEKKLFTFSNLDRRDNPLRQIVNTSYIQKEYIGDWQNDEKKSQWFIQLLNSCLHNHLRNKGLRYDKKHRRYFFPPYKQGTGERVMVWIPAKRKTRRLLVKEVKNPQTMTTSYWKHQAIQNSFMKIGTSYFLKIQPGFTFTKDGYDPVDPKRAGKLSTRWLHDAYNSRFLYDLAFWVNYMKANKFTTGLDADEIAQMIIIQQKDRIAIRTGGANINVSHQSMITDIPVGIESDNHPLEEMLEEVTEELPSLEEVEGEEVELEEEEMYEDDENEEEIFE